MKTNNKFLLVSILLLLLIGIAIVFLNQTTATSSNIKNIGAKYWAGEYQVQLKLNPGKPKVGNNQLTLLVRDANNLPVADMTIQVYAEMPAMGSMQAMREVVTIDHDGVGVYHGEYTLPMNGIWPLTVSLDSNQLGRAKLMFAMSTSSTGLKLTQATPSELSSQASQTMDKQEFSSFNVDNYRRQLIGVTTAKVVCQQLIKTIRAGARVSADETRFTDISLKYDAWIGKLNADSLGKRMRQGQTLFTVYSPDLVSAQDEYLVSLKQNHVYGLRKAARKRLALWDINPAQIKALERRGRAAEYLPILTPVSGTIITKNIVTGSAVKAGETVLRLADLSTVWVEGEIFESDLPWVKVGMEVHITLSDLPSHIYKAKVIFIDSVLNPDTRTAVIRAQLNNAEGQLRPDMYATMSLKVDLGARLVVPEQAVIYAGAQRIVFVDKGDGRLLPVKITTGLINADMIEVTDGLSYGDVIVTSGNFLIAAESKLKAGLAQW